MITIWPLRRASMSGRKAWMLRTAPYTFTSIISCRSASRASASRSSTPKPALTTSTSACPKRARVVLASSASAASFETSVGTAKARSPLKSSSLASVASRSAERAASTTRAPPAAQRRAICSPKPLDAPVITTTLPCRFTRPHSRRARAGRGQPRSGIPGFC